MKNQIHIGDCIEVMRTMPDNSVDSIVTDPPYGLSFMGKKWDYDVPSVDIWRECLRVLKPGGHLLSFAGTRTQHRMACNIEDAGFEIRDMIAWVYGSGFPKSLNIGKAVDKLQGNEREKLGKNPNERVNETENKTVFNQRKECLLTTGTSAWEGWGTALKPALEPITLARKPIDGTVAENCLKWGVGGMNIDESRVGFINAADRDESTGKNKHAEYKNSIVRNSAKNGIYSPDLREPENYSPQGRFPANLIHDNSEEVRECFPESSVTGKRKDKMKGYGGDDWFGRKNHNGEEYCDSGNASRFFKSIIYQPKASKAERNKGCEGLDDKHFQMRPFAEEGCDMGVLKNRMNSKSGKNNHPTVKPVALMEYLIKLITPTGGTVLDPFMGSGTTGIAAKENGFGFIGIEREAEYIEIAEARINSVKQEEPLPRKQLSIFDEINMP